MAGSPRTVERALPGWEVVLPKELAPLRKFRGRDWLSEQDYSRDELMELIHLAIKLKALREHKRSTHFLPDRHLAMIFQEPSTRTRTSFETGMVELGGDAVYLRPGEIHLPGRESVADTARALSCFVDAIEARTGTAAVLQELADNAWVPVINGETGDWDHPSQSLTDAMTIFEHYGRLEGLKMGFIGNGDCMCNSTVMTASRLGMDVVCATPRHVPIDPRVVAIVEQNCDENGTSAVFTEDPREVASTADFVYTSLWWWLDTPEQIAEIRRKNHEAGFQVNADLWSLTKPGARFMHCLPAVRGDEVTDEIIDGDASMVWFQAPNRKHFQKAVILALVGIDELPADPELEEVGCALLE